MPARKKRGAVSECQIYSGGDYVHRWWQSMSLRPILVLAGGTGGHVYPALAVAQALQLEAREIVWLGTHAGLESRVVPAAGIAMEWISVKGLRRKGVIALILAPFRLLLALMQSLRVIWKYRPAAVLGMGGFVSGPGGLAAWFKSSSGASCPGCAAGLPGQFFPWHQSRNSGKSGARRHCRPR